MPIRESIDTAQEAHESGPDRLKEWLGFFKFFFGTFILGLATFLVNKDIQNREVEIKEQEQIAKYIEHAIHDNVGIRLRFAQYFANVTRSEVLRQRWESYLTVAQKDFDEEKRKVEELRAQSENETISGQEKEAILAKIEEGEKALYPKPTERVITLPSRIYVHVRSAEEKLHAHEISNILRGGGFTVPGIQVLSKGPNKSELRYFRKREEEFALAALALLPAVLDVDLVYVPGYEASNQIRERHFELWLAEGALN